MLGVSYPCKLQLGTAWFLQHEVVRGNFHQINCRSEWRLDFNPVLIAEFVPAAYVPYKDSAI